MNHSSQSPTSDPEVLFEAELVAENKPDAKLHSQSHGLRGAAARVKDELLDSWWAVLVLLFCVTGALGLPVLWASRAYSRWMKVFWSIIVLLYTAGLLWLFWQGVLMWWRHMMEQLDKM